MKTRGGLFQSIVLFITEQFLIFPVTFVIFRMSLINSIPIVYITILLFSISAMLIINYVSHKKLIWLFPPLLIAESLSIGFVGGFNTLIAILSGIVILIRASVLIRKRNNGASFYSFVVAGFISYFISAFLFNHSMIFSRFMPHLGICATIAILGTIYCTGMIHLSNERKAADKICRISDRTKKSNFILLLLFSALVLILSSFSFLDEIWGFIKRIFNAILQLFQTIILLFKNVSDPSDLNSDFSIAYDLDKPGDNTIFVYAGILILISAIISALCLYGKKLINFFRFFINKIILLIKDFLSRIRRTQVLDCGYEDDIKSLLKDGESSFSAAKEWLAEKLADDQPYITLKTNAERVRWLYRRLVRKEIKRGLSLNECMTSDKILERIEQSEPGTHTELLELSINAYNESRYSRELQPENSGIQAFKKFYSSKSSRV